MQLLAVLSSAQVSRFSLDVVCITRHQDGQWWIHIDLAFESAYLKVLMDVQVIESHMIFL